MVETAKREEASVKGDTFTKVENEFLQGGSGNAALDADYRKLQDDKDRALAEVLEATRVREAAEAAYKEELTRKRRRTESALENVQKQLRVGRIKQWAATRRWVTGAEILAGVVAPERPATPPPPPTPGSPPVEPIWPLNRVVEGEPQPIYHLRAYSNYLAPKLGLTSADTWTIFSVYLRNLMLNQFILLPTVLALVLVPRILLWLFSIDFDRSGWHAFAELAVTTLMLLAATVGFWKTYGVIARIRTGRRGGYPPDGDVGGEASLGEVCWGILLPLTLVALGLSALFGHRAQPGLGPRYFPASLLLWPWAAHSDPGAIPGREIFWAALIAGAVVGGLRCELSFYQDLRRQLKGGSRLRAARPGEGFHIGRSFKQALAALASGMIAATGLYLVLAAIRLSLIEHGLLAPLMITLAPPLVLFFTGIGSAIEVGLIGGHKEEDMREWRASLGAYFLMIAAAWAVFVGLSLYGPLLIWGTGRTLAAVIAAGWLTTSALGVFAGKSSRTGEAKQSGPLEWIATFAPLVFVLGLVAGVAMLASLAQYVHIPTDYRVEGAPGHYLIDLTHADPVWTIGVWIFAVGLAWYNCTKINVNLFSMHLFYANRLVRCYLGASRPRLAPGEGRPNFAPTNCPVPARRPNPLTGFDPDDDFDLRDLAIVRRWDRAGDLVCDYRGPYPLINAAMNLVSGSELAWQERMAESFLLSPLYCGSQSTVYRKGVVTCDDLDDKDPKERPDSGDGLLKGYSGNLKLGTAISVSGAAASPNMGYHSSPLVTILLTVFNARLGLWLPNPARDTWRKSGPGFATYLYSELTGRTTDKGNYVYLSDGGHFENLGVYELVRRRCRYIVVSDAGADPGSAFWDLGGVVRKCREDFGIPIVIDIAPLLKEPEAGQSRRHHAVGTIGYSEADAGEEDGILIYVKPALTGDEPADIRNYVVEHKDFPHQATADQFFSESQFESYRALGEHTAARVFHKVDAAVDDRPVTPARVFGPFQPPLEPLPPGFDDRFVSAVESLIAARADLGKDRNLAALSGELFPDSDPASGPDDTARAEFHSVARILHVMQKAWVEVDLEGYAEHHMNQGWMKLFGRWAKSPSFVLIWPRVKDEFCEGFVAFYEDQLTV